jgi:hypothetical protein
MPRHLGVLAQAPHRVGIPIAAVGDVDTEAVTGVDQDAAELFVDSEQHLELVAVAGEAVLVEETGGAADQVFVVGGDADVSATDDQLFQGEDKIGPDGLVAFPGDLPGLDVDPLAEADARAFVRQVVDVLQSAAHVGLEDAAQIAVAGVELAVDPQGGVRAGVVLHVDADEVAVPLRGLGDARHVVAAETFVDLETQQGQLDRDVGVDPLALDGVEDPQVFLDGGGRLLPLLDLFAEDVDGPHGALLIERAHDAHGVFQRLSGDVAGGDPADDRLRDDGQTGHQHAVERAHRRPLPSLPDPLSPARTLTPGPSPDPTPPPSPGEGKEAKSVSSLLSR